MNNPRSIFTGSCTSTDESAARSKSRRLNTPEYNEALNAGLEASRSLLSQAPTRPSSRHLPSLPPLWDTNIEAELKNPPKTSHEVPPPPPSSSPRLKKRHVTTSSARTLERFQFSGPSINKTQPPSPLFFSNSRRERPRLPARFSSSEAAARMLSKTHGEDTGIKTVTLARGTPVGSSPSGGSGSSLARTSSDRLSLSGIISPDGKEKSETVRLLGQVGVVELLEQDARPTFIVDLGESYNYTPGPLRLAFLNRTLRGLPGLIDSVTGYAIQDASNTDFQQFKRWIMGLNGQGGTPVIPLPSYSFAGVSWTCSKLRNRLRVVCSTQVISSTSQSNSSMSGSHVTSSGESNALTASSNETETSISAATRQHLESSNEPQDYFGAAAPKAGEVPLPKTKDKMDTKNVDSSHEPDTTEVASSLDMHPSLTNECVLLAVTTADVDSFCSAIRSSPKEIGFFDWTRLPLTDSLPRHIRFARSIDWANTALGPIEFWSADLRQMCNLIMASPHPAAMYWGEDLVAIYNEAYILLAGQKHPTLMGQSYREAWREIWADVEPVFASAKQTGQATMKDDDCLFIKRSDYLEETYFSWSIIPMVGTDGAVSGLYNPAFEKTRRKIAERRMLTLREVGERTASARDVKTFWEQVLAALETNEHDTPFVLLYSVSDDSDSDSSSIHSSSLLGTKICYLEGALGVPPDHPAAPEQLELKTSPEGFGPVFREVMKTDKPVMLDVSSGDLPSKAIEGLEWRGFGDPCRAVVVCPIKPTTGENTLGFLVLGINPRRPYDDDYSLFIQLLSRQLATSLASVVLFEEEIRRGQQAAKLAAQDRIELSEQLAARTQEARESETRFTRMAEFSPAGLFIADSAGHVTYCNDTWYEISRVARDTRSTDRWIDAVLEEDQSLVRNLWAELVEHTKPINAEFRFKAQWEDRNGNKSDTWVLFSAYPEKYEEGMLKSVFGSITNISQQKWAEGFQKRKMEEAVELKRQQENFIDITSHEMRNPLSAILQCADEISSSLTEFRSTNSTTISDELISSNIDAAQTIALCAQHQKRIVDDVLTLSKLDSAMLLVTPVDVQPLNVVQRALKMFEGELVTADIEMTFIIDDSFKELGIDWVRLDPSRVLQVLINLTTNAIKFTTTESKRTIAVTIAASKEKPSTIERRLVNYFPTRSKRVDMTGGIDWGSGEEVYIQFAVRDTGRGLSEEEKKLLFQRFSQASPRTHVQYGGSGLGLFISRELTELQGGEIGVSSEAGKGSTFAFYVKARRTNPPTEPEAMPHSLGKQPLIDPSKLKVKQEPVVKTRDFAVPVSGDVKASSDDPKRSLQVLVVEDNLVNQRVLKKQLQNRGIVVHVANHGGEALDKLQSSQYHVDARAGAFPLNVVLMDQEMPVMDGLQCTRTIREWEQSGKLVCHVPIIAVTANARTAQIEALITAGMDDVVSKPFRIPELLPKIQELAARFPGPCVQPLAKSSSPDAAVKAIAEASEKMKSQAGARDRARPGSSI
ncbi:hypothetical protein M501DRAFT_933958 [Patellaria atrata CBS 101060]|uniref:Histidine kinase n=1 Tax=Patellaria atrata CBS 101060 TaxID=1346257 RepID=A0A9P4VT62_9PEZI|nr:hypothetical protein M501DRAFT_933958 [Patellaria atrata CBS 101060]